MKIKSITDRATSGYLSLMRDHYPSGYSLSDPANIKMFVAERSGVPIACCGIGDFIRDWSTLTDLVVHRDYRHRGVGRSLVQHAKRNVLPNRPLIVPTGSENVDFYERCGLRLCPEAMRSILPGADWVKWMI